MTPNRRRLTAAAFATTLALGAAATAAAQTAEPPGDAPSPLATPTTSTPAANPPMKRGGGAGATNTTAPETAPTGTATDGTATSVPGATAVAPLAEIDIGATGGGIQAGAALDPQTALDNLGLEGMPVAIGSTVAEYRLRTNEELGSDPATTYRSQELIVTADSAMTPEDIRQLYRDAIATLGNYEFTDGSSESDGVRAVYVDARGVEYSDNLPTYSVIVSTAQDVPGVVGIEVTRSVGGIEEPLAPVAPIAEGLLAPALTLGAEAGWTMTSWSMTDGFNQFLGGEPFQSADVRFLAGPGTAADLPALADQVVAAIGEPSSRTDDAESVSLSYGDAGSWLVSYSDSREGNELAVDFSIVP